MDLATIAARIAVGVVVGILVGLTGLGGGMLLLPLLISVLGVPQSLRSGMRSSTALRKLAPAHCTGAVAMSAGDWLSAWLTAASREPLWV